MARPRSPNYPAISLGKAIEAVRPVLKRENRNKMSTLVLAKHLGSNALNGRVLARIGALRSYGLIEGPGDGLRISDDAVDLLIAPENSSERQSALERCAFRPSIFKKLREDSPDLLAPPSIENLRFSLIKEGFTEGAAGRAAKSYLATIGLVTGNASLYDSAEEDEEAGEAAVQAHSPDPAHPKRQSPPAGGKGHAKLMEGERELTTGLLSKDASFRLVVTGAVGVKEIERLIRKLELDKEILADAAPGADPFS
ncbi:MAG: hypothetical protein AB7F08_03725 [Dongiaceae bacterium]